MPSVLIELGYISTHDEEAFLNSQNGIRKMSQSIYNAFVDYRQQHGKGGAGQPSPQEPEPQPDDHAAVEGAAESDIAVLTGEKEASEGQDARPEEAHAPAEKAEARLVFKVQLLAATRQIPAGSKRFKGLSPVDFYKEGGYYKYTYGATGDYQEALELREKAKEYFEGAFIVAFKGEQKVPLSEAIKEYKKNK